jgi:hypothetical protein
LLATVVGNAPNKKKRFHQLVETSQTLPTTPAPAIPAIIPAEAIMVQAKWTRIDGLSQKKSAKMRVSVRLFVSLPFS